MISINKIFYIFFNFIFSTLLALCLLEITCRIFNLGYGHSPLESSPIFHHVHPKNYNFVTHNPTGEYGGFSIYYDENGLNSPKPSVRKVQHNEECRVAFLGDSFTEAVQVEYKNSFVGQVDNQSKCSVKNYGVSSYSPILYLLQWPIIEKSFKPTHVFLQLYGNDIAGDKRYLAKAKINEQGNIYAIPGPGGGLA